MPQLKGKSYKMVEIKIPAELAAPIKAVTSTPGTWQRPFQRIKDFKQVGENWIARVPEPDISLMKKLAQNPKAGSYQKWSLDILKLNGIE